MSVMMFRAKVKAESIPDAEAAVKAMFSALDRAQPKGIRYASCRLADGVTYVGLLEIEDGIEDPRPTMPEFRAFQENLKNWVAEPPIPEELTVIGSYNLFSGASAPVLESGVR
jgi:hypothetical protein